MEQKGNIEELALKTGKAGEFYKLKINNHNFSVFSKTEAYEQLANKQFSLGETVGFDYTETPGSYQGKPITYKNITKLIKVAQAPTAQAQPTLVVKESMENVWALKDKRITRMSCLSSAIAFFQMNQMSLPDEAKGISEVTILKLAEKFENWVYREEAKEATILGEN